MTYRSKKSPLSPIRIAIYIFAFVVLGESALHLIPPRATDTSLSHKRKLTVVAHPESKDKPTKDPFAAAPADTAIAARRKAIEELPNVRAVKELMNRPLYTSAQVMISEDGATDETGTFARTTILKTHLKYPLVRTVDRVYRDPQINDEFTIARDTMVADHLMVKLLPGVRESLFTQAVRELGFGVRKYSANTGIYLISIPAENPGDFKSALQRLHSLTAMVRAAEPDYVVQLDATPNDPLFSKEWGLENRGLEPLGFPGSDIGGPSAWDISTGSKNILVGVIDSGMDYAHEDLAANIWTNPSEAPGDKNSDSCAGVCMADDDGDGLVDEDSAGCGRNGRKLSGEACQWKNDLVADDDENGYKDDIHGYDFACDDSDPDIYSTTCPYWPYGDLYPDIHATHVAGTIGAVTNNGKGVAGVAHNVTMIPLRGLYGLGGMTSDLAEAIAYATARKVFVTNNSWGGGPRSQAIEDEIVRANNAGILFVAAAGNNANNNDKIPSYPASIARPNVLSVAATDPFDTLAYFSNYGAASVDLAAPGVAIFSALPKNTYGNLSGTSMATPHVTGAAVVLKSLAPGLTATDIKRILIDGAEIVGSLEGLVRSGARLNLQRSLQLVSQHVTVGAPRYIDDGSAGTQGNADGIANPGETIVARIPILNRSTSALSNVTGRLERIDTTPGLTLLSNSVTVGPISSAAAGSAEFKFTIAPSVTFETHFPLKLVLQTGLGGLPEERTLHLIIHNSASVSGKVLLDGAPLANASVKVSGIMSASAVTNRDGIYSLSLIAGQYTEKVSYPGTVFFGSNRFAVPVTQKVIDLDYVTGGSVEARDAITGAPIPNSYIEIGDTVAASPSLEYLNQGEEKLGIAFPRNLAYSFSLRVLAPGRYFPEEFSVDATRFGEHFIAKLMPGSADMTIKRNFAVGHFPKITGSAKDGTVVGVDNDIYNMTSSAFVMTRGGEYTDLNSTIAAELFGTPNPLTAELAPFYNSAAFGISSSGDVVGSIVAYDTQTGELTAINPWIKSGNTIIALPLLPNDTFGEAYNINSAGTIVGTSSHATSTGIVGQVVIWRLVNGAYRVEVLPILTPVTGLMPGANLFINDKGVVATTVSRSKGIGIPMLWNGTSFTELPLPQGMKSAQVYGLNDDGDVFGGVTDGSGRAASFVYRNGGYILAPASNWDSVAFALDYNPEQVDILGGIRSEFEASDQNTAALWRNGKRYIIGDIIAQNDHPRTQWWSPFARYAVAQAVRFTDNDSIPIAGYDNDQALFFLGTMTRPGKFPVRPTPTPTPSATPTLTPTPSPSPRNSELPQLTTADFDGDGVSDMGIVVASSKKSPGGEKAKGLSNRIRLSIDGRERKIKFGRRKSVAVHGHYLPGNNWQLGYATVVKKRAINWELFDPVTMTKLSLAFGNKGDKVLGGCSLVGQDNLNDMVLLRGASEIIIRNSQSGEITKRSLSLGAGESLLDLTCGTFVPDTGAEQFLAALLKSADGKYHSAIFSVDGTALLRVDLAAKASRILAVDGDGNRVSELLLLDTESSKANLSGERLGVDIISEQVTSQKVNYVGASDPIVETSERADTIVVRAGKEIRRISVDGSALGTVMRKLKPDQRLMETRRLLVP